jgi:membrane protein DedA with SNARE-associated domain
MRIANFMLSVFVGRVLRDMITAILTIRYGPEIVNITTRLATQHRVALMIGLTTLVAASIYWAWRKVWRRRNGQDGPGIDAGLTRQSK